MRTGLAIASVSAVAVVLLLSGLGGGPASSRVLARPGSPSGFGVLSSTSVSPAPTASNVTTAVWTHIYPGGHPTPPAGASMAYDPATHGILLFGGQVGQGGYPLTLSNQTWEFANGTWTVLSPHHVPDRRMEAAMAYDAALRAIVMYGGQGVPKSRVLNDTWEWINGDWKLLKQNATRPGNLAGATMAYYPSLGGDVLFGGSVYNASSSTYSAATWLLRGGHWSLIPTSFAPGQRRLATLAYDANAHRLILTGGVSVSPPYGLFSDTWSFNRTGWTLLAPATPAPPRWGATMNFDGALGALVLHGGANAGGTYQNGTWAFAHDTWTNVTTARNPGPRGLASMAYDPVTGAVVLFGGFGCAGPPSRCSSTWTYR